MIVGVSPRDTLRRDETKEMLLKVLYSSLRLGFQKSTIMHMEAIDGNAIFAIPRAQVAEVLFDGCWYFANRFPTKVATLRFMCTSRTLLEQYAKVFTKRYEKLMQDQEEAGPHSEENPPSNFMLDVYQDDFEWIRLYGMHQKQLYNDCGTAVTIDLYDTFVACERRFGRPKSPVLLAQVKSYLRDVQNATDMQLNAIIQRRQKECQKVVIEAFEKFKSNHVEFFRHLCVYNLQFCKEILIKTIKEIASLDNMFLPPSQLSKMLQRYAGEEESAAIEENGDSTTNAPGSPSQQRTGAQRTASEIFIAKNNKGKRRSTGRPVKRRSARPNGANGGGMSPSPSSESISTPTGTLRNGAAFDEIEVDPYQVARDRIGKDAVTNWTYLMDVLYSANMKVTNMAFDVTQTADADKLAAALVRIFYFNDDALSLLRLAIKNEVDKTPVLSTLFRQNSMASKMLTTFSRLVSRSYLVKILSPCIEKVVEAGDDLEVDPSKLKGENADLKANQERLKAVTDLLISDICKSVDLLPYPCRAICAILKEVVEPKFPDGANVAIAGFLVLRLINPVLVVPDAEGIEILSKEKTAQARRGLLLVSKLIQNLANQVDFKKEEFMITFNSFVSEKFALMEDFFLECASTRDGEAEQQSTPSESEITPAVFNESLRIVSNIFILSKDKYLPLLEMDGETLDEFKALVSNPIEGNSSTAVTTAPISLKDGSTAAGGDTPTLNKKESSMFAAKKEKEKEKEKKAEKAEKENQKKAEKEKEKAEKEKEKAEKEKEKAEKEAHKKEEKKAEKDKKKDDDKKDKKKEEKVDKPEKEEKEKKEKEKEKEKDKEKEKEKEKKK